MAAGRMSGEWLARTIVVAAVLVAPLALLVPTDSTDDVALRAAMPGDTPTDEGGWMPDRLRAQVGVPLDLRLISDDVVHGFAVGQMDTPAVDVLPGRSVELTLVFDKPGTYTYYCTRWCGPNHWLMRGTIEVAGGGDHTPSFAAPPLYKLLELDIDAPHQVDVRLDRPPSSARGKRLLDAVPVDRLSHEAYLTRTPDEIWQALRRKIPAPPGAEVEQPARADAATARLSDAELWDLLAVQWRSHATDRQRQEGEALYQVQCAACHGSYGTGDGIMANRGWWDSGDALLERPAPADFTDPTTMLGASTALLDGKIRRGGMGTGMPSFLRILNDEQIEALVAYLWSFQFPVLAPCCIDVGANDDTKGEDSGGR